MSEWKLVFTPKRGSKNKANKGNSSAVQQSVNVTDEVINAQEESADSNMNGKTANGLVELDGKTKELEHEQLSIKLGTLIKRGRQINKITQKDLATKTSLKLKVIRDYEANRGIFKKKEIEKIQEALEMQLMVENGAKYGLPDIIKE